MIIKVSNSMTSREWNGSFTLCFLCTPYYLKGSMTKTEKEISERLEPVLAAMGIELIEVTCRTSNGSKVFTVFIDHPDGVDLQMCERAHYAVDPVFDEINPTNEEPYTLNVSSPGLDRPIVTDRDYSKNIGREVEIYLNSTFEKKKYFEGVLTGKDGDNVYFTELKTDRQYALPVVKITKMTKLIKF